MSNLPPAPKITHEDSADDYVDPSERFIASDPMWVFAGAIVCSGNSLLTGQQRFVHLFEELQVGNIPYPKSVQNIVDGLEIEKGYTLPYSRRIENMFSRISMIYSDNAIGIRWPALADQETHADRYYFDHDSKLLYNFFERWGNDEEALKFFEQCADFLAIKE